MPYNSSELDVVTLFFEVIGERLVLSTEKNAFSLLNDD